MRWIFLVAACCLSSSLPLPLGEEEQGGNGERERDYGVGLAFICVHTLMMWRRWQGMDAMWWLGSEPVGHDSV
jgi:hypothetical protein